jgi:mono/diheme cytochrome c family protein
VDYADGSGGSAGIAGDSSTRGAYGGSPSSKGTPDDREKSATASGGAGGISAGNGGASPTPAQAGGGAMATAAGVGGAGAGAASAGGSSAGANTGGATAAPPLDCQIVRLQARAILTDNCGKCHGPGTSVANFDYVLDADKLKGSGKLVPGKPDESPLYRRISRGEMPPAGVTPRPEPEQTALLFQWIKSCLGDAAPGMPTASCGTPPEDTQSMLREMVGDLERFDLRDRRFIRYFTLNHIRNAGACEDEMDVYRYALGKAVNALSQGTQIIAPVAIDDYRSIYRVDLRDYEWDASGTRSDKWEILAARNPYAFELEEDDATILKDFTETRFPFQAGDWFVNQGTQPPLYHEMLDIPATRQELERQLGINIASDVENGDVWRSGFLDSGISEQNRVIERHELPVSNARTFWISFDFAGNGGRENIFADPLDFEADGSEIIFTLPNGFHGYMLANAAGTRLDEAPDVIVSDPNQPDGNVRNGISCMGCHGDGIKNKPDEIRTYVSGSSDFDVNEKEAVKELYPVSSVFDGLVARDSRLFLEAVAAVDPPAGITTEPILDVFERFESNVDLKRAAAELGITPQALLRELGGLDPALAPLGYGTVKRTTFRDHFAESVCLLKLGLADDPACGKD